MSNTTSTTAKQIVLLGIGHTNAHVLKQWASEPIPGCELTCISQYPSATYSGMLPGTLGDQFRDDEMRINLQCLADQAGAKLLLVNTIGIDRDSSKIHFSDHEPISFDALSIGVGSMPAGWDEHASSPTVVPIKPMQTFLERLDNRLETAGQQTPHSLKVAIVGGGVASVETAFCFQQQVRKSQASAEISIEIFTSDKHVASGMTNKSIRRIEKLLKARSISVHTQSRVTEVTAHEIATDDGRRFQTDCVIWATGATAPPVLKELGLETDDRGFLSISKTLKSVSDPRIFAVGDSGTFTPNPWPKAGVYAVRQAPVLWHNLRAVIQGEQPIEYQPQSNFLKLLNTGDGKAILEYGSFTFHAGWCWHLKTWIDRHFIHQYQTGC
ncbi:pyridine nucleotide-disulfide oxidoreductase family protein [Neorhodopirellula lusitana]|uniref:Pyridine nucleotide-disulfide oxidoreductase family protein n=1 Tax=Neorhodopirellula lusitana TaxID=445327 RepID=A0ABY1PSY8_9BACT|nr:FAD-dependent oxidoreductase [Neorhodopirellula lusitana]SMP46212.1 pyridine nucleotide-disulfide oxidoreductase family protein [Neorhodopirellula lusitana]